MADSEVRYRLCVCLESHEAVFTLERLLVASNQTGRPDIILSGDDNGKLFMLRPKGSDTASPFTYIPYTLVDKSPGTVGEMAIGDLDADGYTDILLPCYTAGKVKILTYAPPTTGMWQKVRSWFGALLSANFLW